MMIMNTSDVITVKMIVEIVMITYRDDDYDHWWW